MDIPSYDAGRVHQQGFGQVTFGSDDKLITWFFDKPILNGIKSKEAGRPIYENVTHVHIQQPGERDFLECPATQEHAERFPRKWAAFKAQMEQKIEGTLLSVLFPTNPALVESLKHINILTIEQLGALNDTQIQNIGLGGRQFVDLAQKFLAQAEKGKTFNALADQIKALELRMTEKDTRIDALEKALAQAGAEDPKPKRGQKAA